jgi:hypothetical protein
VVIGVVVWSADPLNDMGVGSVAGRRGKHQGMRRRKEEQKGKR